MLTYIMLHLPQFMAVVPSKCEKHRFFGLVPWFHYLDADSKCNIINFRTLGSNSSLLLILLAVVEDLLRIAGIVAVGFIVYGGIQYITSQGEADKAKKAQETLINALVGLVVALVAVALVSFIANKLGK